MTRKSVVYLTLVANKSAVDNFNDNQNDRFYENNNLQRRDYKFEASSPAETLLGVQTHYVSHAWCDDDEINYLEQVTGIQIISQDRMKHGRTLESIEHAEDFLNSRSLRLKREQFAQSFSNRGKI